MRATRSTALAAAVVTAALAGGSLVSVGTAYADPTGGAAAGQLVGVGSDTTQDVLNALSKSVSVDPGGIVEHGPTDAMFHDPQDPRTEDYVNGRFG